MLSSTTIITNAFPYLFYTTIKKIAVLRTFTQRFHCLLKISENVRIKTKHLIGLAEVPDLFRKIWCLWIRFSLRIPAVCFDFQFSFFSDRSLGLSKLKPAIMFGAFWSISCFLSRNVNVCLLQFPVHTRRSSLNAVSFAKIPVARLDHT